MPSLKSLSFLCVIGLFLIMALLPWPYLLGHFITDPLALPANMILPFIISWHTALKLYLISSGLAALWAIPAAFLLHYAPIKGKGFWALLLMLPLGVPAYLNGAVYSDLFYYSGDFALLYTEITGWTISFNMHSLFGCGLILSLALYPYLFMPLFLRLKYGGDALYAYPKTIGLSTPRHLFIILKSCVPVILFAETLILLETLSDYGTVSHYGIRTPALFLFDYWQQSNNLPVAIAITMMIMLITLLLFTLSMHYYKKKLYHQTMQAQTASLIPLSKCGRLMAYVFLLLILIMALGIPIGFFTYHTFMQPMIESGLIGSLFYNSIIPAMIASGLCLIGALSLSLYQQHHHTSRLNPLIRAITSGYAFPNVILAILVYAVLLGVNHLINGVFSLKLSFVTGTWLGLILCYYIKFLTVAYGTLSPVYKTIPPSLFPSLQSMGHNAFQAGVRLYPAYLKGPLLISFIMVSVDILKELPITLLLRPIGFETMASYSYMMASLEQLDQAAPAALLLIALGTSAALLPILPVVQK